MLVLTLVAPVFATNCYLLARGDGRECVVVDPGAGVAPAVLAAVREHGLTPVAVLATHGHVDHTWDAAELCETFGVPLHVHARDAYRLADPFGTLGLAGATQGVTGALRAALRGVGRDPGDYVVPADVRRIETSERGSARLDLADLPITVLHAPGHTEGASMFALPWGPAAGSVVPLGDGWEHDVSQASRTVLTGDVLFAGTVGRTDLPGGDAAAMDVTLRDQVGMLAPDVLVLPGHGPGSRMDVEYRRNPFLAEIGDL